MGVSEIDERKGGWGGRNGEVIGVMGWKKGEGIMGERGIWEGIMKKVDGGWNEGIERWV